jgi:hypothetical protein
LGHGFVFLNRERVGWPSDPTSYARRNAEESRARYALQIVPRPALAAAAGEEWVRFER